MSLSRQAGVINFCFNVGKQTFAIFFILLQSKLRQINIHFTAQKMKFSIKVFFSKCDQIRSVLCIWSHLLKKSLIENFIFCVVTPHSLDSTDSKFSSFTTRQKNHSNTGLTYFVTPLQKQSASIYLFKVNNRNTRKRSGICSELTIKTPEQRQWHRFGVFIVSFEHIFTRFSSVFTVDFQPVNVRWAGFPFKTSANSANFFQALLILVFFFFFLYHNKIHPLTNYKAIKNKSNRTRQHRTQNLHKTYTT